VKDRRRRCKNEGLVGVAARRVLVSEQTRVPALKRSAVAVLIYFVIGREHAAVADGWIRRIHRLGAGLARHEPRRGGGGARNERTVVSVGLTVGIGYHVGLAARDVEQPALLHTEISPSPTAPSA
jgi:hypothetical protein